MVKRVILMIFALVLVGGFITWNDPALAVSKHILNESNNTVSLGNGLWIKAAFFLSVEDVNVILDVYDGDPEKTTSNNIGSTDILEEGAVAENYSFEQGAFSVKLIDSSWGPSGGSATIEIDVKEDFEFAVSLIKISDTTFSVDGASIVIEYATNVAVTSKIEYCIQMTCSDPEFKDKDIRTTDHLLTLDELEPARIYKYRIIGVAESGKVHVHPEEGEEWLSFIIEEPPVAPMDEPYVLLMDESTVKVNFVTIEDTFAHIRYGLENAGEEVQSNFEYAVGLHSVQIDDLRPASIYKYQIVLVNRAAEHSFSPVYTFRTSASPITVVGLNATRLSDTSVEISWHTDGRCKGGVRYQIDGGDVMESVSDIFATSHHVTLRDLDLTSAYTYWTICELPEGDVIEDSNEYILIATHKPAEQDQTSTDLPGSEGSDDSIVQREKTLTRSVDQALTRNVQGKILLQVEEKGEAWYVNPSDQRRYYLGRPALAFQVMRDTGIGITNANLSMIPIGVGPTTDGDDDNDGLPNALEEALGTSPMNTDSDGDGYSDSTEVSNNYNPLGSGRLNIDNAFTDQHKGKIFLQVESLGEAWYVNPEDGKRYFLGRPADAFSLMQTLGLGATNEDLRRVEVGEL